MARTTTPLNATQIEKAKPRSKEYNLADGQGLMLRIKPNGSKAWYFNYYHPHTKKRKSISFGLYPELTLALARNQRDKARALVQAGIDPQEQREKDRLCNQEKANNTFKLIAEKWMALHAQKVSEGTMQNIERYFEKDVFPIIGRYPIGQITAPKATEVLKAIIDRSSLEIARKVARRLNNVMTFAVNTGYVHHNPLSGIRELIPTSKVRHQPTLAPDELPELMQAIQYSNAKLVTRCLVEFQLHTMVRPIEAAETEWTEIDFENRIWTIPAARMKMRKPHSVPLSEPAIKLLESLKPISGHRRYVFPSAIDPKKPANSQSANKALRDMGFSGRLVAHGMRSLASTTLNEQGFDADVIEAALAHKDDNAVRSAYNRAQYLERRKVMMGWWSERIEQAKSGQIYTRTVKNLRLVNQ